MGHEMAVNIKDLVAKNQDRWDNMKLDPDRQATLEERANVLVKAKPRFQQVYAKLEKAGYTDPQWWFIAVCAEREAYGPPRCYTCQLAQGDPLGHKSTHVPIDRGPFLGPDAFDRGCLDALIDCPPHAAVWHDWTAGGAATIWEEYNGLGYAGRGVPSAYVWSGSNAYVSGKYVADHLYRANVKDVQEGCMPLVKAMMALDSSIKFEGKAGIPYIPGHEVKTSMNYKGPAPSIWQIFWDNFKNL